MINHHISRWLPIRTLMYKETLRFMAVPLQTLGAPLVTASLFFFIFGINIGSRTSLGTDVSYMAFIVPGLMLMGIINNSFMNTSSSLFFSKYINNIVDLLVTPLMPVEIILAYTLPAMLRGLIVAIMTYFVSVFFTPLPWAHPFLALIMGLLVSFLFAQLGLTVAVFSKSFDGLTVYTNFLLLPLIYLGGVFYPIHILPPFWLAVSKLNPIFYMIDGFRHAILGTEGAPLLISFLFTAIFCVISFSCNVWIFSKGFRLRS